jgi:hypothetical protein
MTNKKAKAKANAGLSTTSAKSADFGRDDKLGRVERE